MAAYSYMALVPIIQPFAVKLVTTKKERQIRMVYEPGNVSKATRIAFPIIVTIIVGMIAPSSVALVGFLMFGNLIRECGVLNSLSDAAQNNLSNLITLLLGITISFSMQAESFVNVNTILIMVIGLLAFIFDSHRRCSAGEADQRILQGEDQPHDRRGRYFRFPDVLPCYPEDGAG